MTATVLLRPGESALGELGGKGASLANLVEARHRVPPTGVITTNAYRTIAASSEVRSLVEQVLAGDVDDPADIDQRFAMLDVADDLERDIIELAAAVGGGGPVAVRSSATVEDLHGSSFAGQYQSFLDVDSSDPVDVMGAVRKVWSSLWHPAPTAYRDAFGIDQSDVAMAVVIMAMIPATSAGVVFTVDPGGQPGAARVEAVEGLGEALVSGQATPSAWVVDRAAADELPSAPATALAMALEIEAMVGVPQDIEWAAEDDEVFVVQARPITVLEVDDGFDTPIDDHVLTAAGIVEMVPGVLEPLPWQVNRRLLEEAFRSLLDGLGIISGDETDDRPFVRRVRGRAAIDFDQLQAAARSVPGAAEELELQYFGTATAGNSKAGDPNSGRRRRNPLSAISRDLRTLRVRRTVVQQGEIVIATVDAFRDATPDLAVSSDAELLAYLRRLVGLGGRALIAELGVAAAAAASYQRLELIVAKHLGLDAATGLVQGVTTLDSQRERRRHGAAAVFLGPTWSELGIEPPRVRSDPEERSRRQAELETRITSQRGWRRRRILTGQIVDTRIHLIRRTIDEVIEQLGRREATKVAYLEIGGFARQATLEAGRRLVARGLLHDPVDVTLLTSDELVRALTHGDGIEVDVLGRRRNWISRYEAEGQLPARFVGVPDREPTPLPDGDVLEGWAASPGRRRGTARVVRSATGDLGRGEILVAEATDASWSPLFVKAGGVVVERGGPLSHAAILARELGLPAVLNVDGATRVLDGATVSVDGDQGVVVIEDRQGTQGD